FFQAEDGIRDRNVTGVQTCALPISQEQLAEMLSVSRQAVSKWENGLSYPDMDKIISISKILNCTLEDLLDDGVIKHDSQPEEPRSEERRVGKECSRRWWA